MKHLIVMLLAVCLIGCGSSGNGGGGGSFVAAQVPDLIDNEKDNNEGDPLKPNGDGNNIDNGQMPDLPDTNDEDSKKPEPNTDGSNKNEPDTDSGNKGKDPNSDNNGSGEVDNPPAPTIKNIPLPEIVPNYLERIITLQGYYFNRGDYLDNGNYRTSNFNFYGSDSSGIDVSRLAMEQPNKVWSQPYGDKSWSVRKYDERNNDLVSNTTNLEIIYGLYPYPPSTSDNGTPYNNDYFLAASGDTIRSLPVGTHNYGGEGNSMNVVRTHRYVSYRDPNPVESSLNNSLGFGTVEIEVNFDNMTGSINGNTIQNRQFDGSEFENGEIPYGTNMTGKLIIDANNGSFSGKGRMKVELPILKYETDEFSRSIGIYGTFHGTNAEGISGVYQGWGNGNGYGAFIANKRQ